MGIPTDMLNFLTKKYNIAQQEADARSLGARADADLAGVRGGAITSALPSENALRAAQAGLLNTQASLAPSELASQNKARETQSAEAFSNIFNRDREADFFRLPFNARQQPLLEDRAARRYRDYESLRGGAIGSYDR